MLTFNSFSVKFQCYRINYTEIDLSNFLLREIMKSLMCKSQKQLRKSSLYLLKVFNYFKKFNRNF